MEIIGITGGIGSGKSEVSRIFRDLGFSVYNSDSEAKNIVNTDSQTKNKITELLGSQAYDALGNYDTKYVSKKVFNDSQLLERLNQIIHPAVDQHFNEWVKKQATDFVFKETALLFELNLDKECYKTILVTADENIRIERVMKRDKRTQEEIQKIIQKQMPETEKIKRADFIIQNNSTLSHLQNEAKRILQQFVV